MQIQTSYRKPISTEIKTANNTFKYFSFSSQPTKDSLNLHQLRLSSTKKNTISGESISETSAFPVYTKQPINLKKQGTIISPQYSDKLNDDLSDPSSRRNKGNQPFKAFNAISVIERNLIRRVTQKLKDTSELQKRIIASSQRSKTLMLKKPKFNGFGQKKANNSVNIKSNSKQKEKATRNIKQSLVALKNKDYLSFVDIGLKENLSLYTKESKKYQKPNIHGGLKTISGNVIKPFKSCSLFLKKKINKPNLTQRLIKMHTNEVMTIDFKQAIKWEGIRQLWQNHSMILEKLLKDYKVYKWFLEKEEYITEKAVKEFMRLIEMESSPEFFEDAFELFSCENVNVMNHKKTKLMNIKEFFQCIVMTSRNVSFEVKLEMLCDIWEVVHTNLINIKEVLYLLKDCFYYHNDYESFSSVLHKKYSIEKGTQIQRIEFHKFIISNPKTKKILYRNICFDQKIVQDIFKEEVINVVNSNEKSWKSHLNYYDIKTYSGGFIKRFDGVLNSIYQAKLNRKKNAEIWNIEHKYNTMGNESNYED